MKDAVLCLAADSVTRHPADMISYIISYIAGIQRQLAADPPGVSAAGLFHTASGYFLMQPAPYATSHLCFFTE